MIAVLRLEQVELVAEVEQRRPVGVGDFVGRLDAVAQRLDLSAGIAGDTLEGIDSTEESALRELAIKTVSRREVTVGRNLVDDPPHEEWGEHAQNHGYRTCAFIPLVYDDTLYGVLHLATDRPEGFGTAERESLGELGRTIAYALETAASSTAAHGTVREEVETDLTRWTAEPEQERRLYETIISSTPDLVYAFDLDYRFIFANDALQTKEPVRGEVGFEHAELGHRIYDYIFAPVLDDEGGGRSHRRGDARHHRAQGGRGGASEKRGTRRKISPLTFTQLSGIFSILE